MHLFLFQRKELEGVFQLEGVFCKDLWFLRSAVLKDTILVRDKRVQSRDTVSIDFLCSG